MRLKKCYKIFSPKASGQELFRLKINQINILLKSNGIDCHKIQTILVSQFQAKSGEDYC